MGPHNGLGRLMPVINPPLVYEQVPRTSAGFLRFLGGTSDGRESIQSGLSSLRQHQVAKLSALQLGEDFSRRVMARQTYQISVSGGS